jgi:hypothetical protein
MLAGPWVTFALGIPSAWTEAYPATAFVRDG